MSNFIDQNNVVAFVDQNGVTLFVDQNGAFLGLGGVGDTLVFPSIIMDQDAFYQPSVFATSAAPPPSIRVSVFYH